MVPWNDGMPTFGGLQLAATCGFAPITDGVPVSSATCEVNKTVTVTVIPTFPDHGSNPAICGIAHGRTLQF